MVYLCENTYNNTEYDNYFSNYSFPLSVFQKYAIEGILKGNHVLVTAHTGSGKTLPAEFAIDYFTKQNKKVIYTSPIKALSNQKFYEFTQKFPSISIGLFTGDIKTNPEADVLIMTTEILQNTLFNNIHSENDGKQMMFEMDFENELAAVVFDEVHYINDEDRGQVWEKCLVMLPEHVQKIMLSATMDNAFGFAQWCEQIHEESNKCVYLSTTTHRVVPLSHYSYMVAGEQLLKSIKNKEIQQDIRKNTNTLIKIQNERGVFDELKGYKTIKRMEEYFHTYKANIKRKFVLNQLSKYLRDNNMLPAIGFVFSRKQVEFCAQEITTPLLPDDSKIPYTVKRECEQIIRRLPNHEEYMRLPEYNDLIKLLEKGIGIHHSGMIPILREIVEMCISKKYIQLLFATESFAIGLDCPIKTAVFTGINKFDGNHQRILMSHEYTQMAGRAGRRGIDTIGYVVHCNNLFTLPDKKTYETMLNGKPPKLQSKFRLSYDLILNVLKTKTETGHNMNTLTTYAEKSIMASELSEEIVNQQKLIKNFTQKIWTNDISQDVCKEYKDLKENLKKAVNKKKKDLNKKMNQFLTDYPNIENAITQYNEYVETERNHENNIEYLHFLQRFINDKIKRTNDLMIHKNFIENTDGIYTMTNLGILAAHISEVHSLPWIECIVQKWNYFENFNVKQLIAVFSCATDIKVNSDIKRHAPYSKDTFIKNALIDLANVNESYAQLESQYDLNTGINYEQLLSYDIVDEAMEWCDCDSEEKCKYFINSSLKEKEISTGDFTKAMMKVATIARELQTLGELEPCKTQTEFIHKLSQVESLVLKFIATNQSLYV